MNKTEQTYLNITDGYLQQLEDTGTNAFAYLTIYPFNDFDGVTDAQLDELGDRLLRIISRGRKIFLRLYPEMNGSWFIYGQKPAAFIAAWRRAVTALNTKLGPSNRDKVAYIWAPNSGNDYPWLGQTFSPNPSDLPDASIGVDTNGNQRLDRLDDPYSPFYPGDEWVDWVGLSIYHCKYLIWIALVDHPLAALYLTRFLFYFYLFCFSSMADGREYPWRQNVIPEEDKFESILQGLRLTRSPLSASTPSTACSAVHQETAPSRVVTNLYPC
ncbi:hypothetical protein BC829DRAFT_376962 [Chytridium lagenaria]|nr:hypothetical protein BC829DRAFT_376962 [Chytridium lagenaria]